MDNYLRAGLDKLIKGDVLSICVGIDELDAALKELDELNIPHYESDGNGDVIIERTDTELKTYDYPSGIINSNGNIVNWEVIPNGEKGLKLNLGEYGTVLLTAIFIDGAKMLGIHLPEIGKINSEDCMEMLNKVGEFFNEYEGIKYVLVKK